MHPTFTNRLFTTMQVLALAYMLGPSALAQDLPEHKDIVYGTVDGKELGLDRRSLRSPGISLRSRSFCDTCTRKRCCRAMCRL